MTVTVFERPNRSPNRDNISGVEWAVTVFDGERSVTRSFGDDEALARRVAEHLETRS